MRKNDDNKEVEEKKVKDKDLTGKRFEDLDEDEMEKIQGSGNDDMGVEDAKTILGLISSQSGYICK